MKVVVDSSAILSILFAEPDSDEILIAINERTNALSLLKLLGDSDSRRFHEGSSCDPQI